MSPFTKGRRWLAAGSVTTLVVALLHTLGNTLGPPPDQGLQTVRSAMQGYRVPLGLGMDPSVWDIYRCLAFTMSICLVGMGTLGLALGAARDASPRLLARVSAVMALTSGALAALSYVYRIPPPLMSFVVTTILFSIASVTTRA